MLGDLLMHYANKQETNQILEASRLDERLGKYKRRLLVYLAGKYRDKDEHSVDCNIHYAKLVAVELWKMGFAVICQHSNSDHMGFDGDDGVFLEGDMVMVERSDLVVMLDRWEDSEGARQERRLAMRLEIPVYYWCVHQLALQSIASNDPRKRCARDVMVKRAEKIALITGYQPNGVHVASGVAEDNCGTCGTSLGKGMASCANPGMMGRFLEAFLQRSNGGYPSDGD